MIITTLVFVSSVSIITHNKIRHCINNVCVICCDIIIFTVEWKTLDVT